MDELKLTAQAKNGDQDAFCALYGLYKDRLYRYAFYRLRSQQDAEDAVSECVLSAWRQIGSLRQEKAFAAWIFRILSACCGRLIAKQIDRRNELNLDASCVGGPAGAGASAEAHAASEAHARAAFAQHEDPDTRLILEDALTHLTEEERNIVLLSVISGLKSKEIAQICGKTPGSVRSSLSRSLKKLRGYLK